jgi:YbbR domain-containing protein
MIGFLRNFFFRDWLLKLFSLTLAILTWLAVSFSLKQRVTPVPGTLNVSEKTYFDVPVTIVSRDMDVSRFKADPSKVDVTLQGSEAILQQLPKTSVRVLVDVSGTVLKQPQKMPVEIITPAGVAHVRTRPDNLVQISPPIGSRNESETAPP